MIWLIQVGVVLVLAALVPLVVLGLLTTSQSQQVVRDEVAARLRLTTALSGSLISEHFAAVVAVVEAQAVAEGMVRATADGDPQLFDNDEINRQLQALQSSRSDLKGVALLDLEGVMRASTRSPERIGEDFSDRGYFQGLLATGSAFVSGAFAGGSAAANPYVVSIATYVRPATADGAVPARPLAVLVVSIKLDQIQLVVDDLAQGQQVDLWVTDQNGIVLAKPGGLPVSLEPVVDTEIGATASSAAGQLSTAQVNGQEALVVRENAGPPGWALYAATNRDQAYAGAASIQVTVLAIGIPLALVVCFGIAVLLTKHRRQWDTENALSTARDEARAANRRKSEFLANMSHELRTPLNSILGFGRLLEMDSLTAQQRFNVGYIVRSGEHLLGLIDEVLDISRVERGELRLSMEPVCLGEVVREAIGMCRPLADRRMIQIVDSVPATDTHVLADRQRLTQVVVNLLANAVKYNQESGRILVEAMESPGVCRLSVSDTGIGMAEDDLGRLFQPFERLTNGGSQVEGTGLGLALTKRLVTEMGGRVGVRSQAGEGSTFWVELPLADAPADQHLAEQAPIDAAVPPRSREPMSLLYIEDNLSNVRLLEQVMRRRPHADLMVAMQGRIGIQMAVEHRPDLILLDLHLPDLSGEEVLIELRADPRTAQTPVVILSADATSAQSRRSTFTGATGFLSKPFDIAKLLELIDHLGVIPPGAAQETGSNARAARLAMAVDITRAEIAGGGNDDMAGERFEVFAHELINLLGVVLTYGELLESGVTDPTVASHLSQVCVAAENAVELTRDLLAAERVEERVRRPADIATG